MIGKVITRSVYIQGAAASTMPNQCRVLEISSLLRQLLIAAVDLPVEYEAGSRAEAIVNLLLLELRAARRHPLVVPFPADDALATRCRRFLERPSAHESIDAWAGTLAMSRRTFTRMFRRETGLSLAEWQRRAAVLQAIPRLTRGEPITTIALDLGYGSPAAFTSMFKRVLGTLPRLYRALASRERNATV
jgi:AraC-like DNA-binding protein